MVSWRNEKKLGPFFYSNERNSKFFIDIYVEETWASVTPLGPWWGHGQQEFNLVLYSLHSLQLPHDVPNVILMTFSLKRLLDWQICHELTNELVRREFTKWNARHEADIS